MVSPWKSCLVSVILIFISSFGLANPGQTLPKKKIEVGGKKITVEVAETNLQQAMGLMFRKKMHADEGMLFVFKSEETRHFWMKNTFLDLAIAFFDGNGTLVDIQEMKSGKGIPDDLLVNYKSAKPSKYALEMNKGWFTKNKIKVGDKMKIE